MIPFFIVATACISVFFSIWSHPDGPQWAHEHGQLLLSNANRVRLGIESRTGIKLLPPPPLETTHFEPGSSPLSRETYVLKTSEAGLRPSTVGLALVSVFTVAAVSFWLVRRIRLVRLRAQSSRHIPECRLPVHRPPPTFLVTRDSAEAVDGPPPPQPALEFFESDVGVVADDQLSSQDTEFDYPVNPWSDQAVYVEETWSDPILSEEELSSWEDEADDWSMVKRTDPATRFGPEPQSTWAQLPLMLPAGLEPATSDFNNLAPVCLDEISAVISAQDALPELRKGCRVYADEEEARITMQKAVKRIIREQLELDPSSIAVPKDYHAPPVIPGEGSLGAPGSHSVPSTPSRSNTPVGTVSTGNKKNRRRGGRWKRQLAAAMAAEIASGNSGHSGFLAEVDASNLDPTVMRLVDTPSIPATTDTEASF